MLVLGQKVFNGLTGASWTKKKAISICE